MPTLILVGGRQVNVSEEKGNKIVEWKGDPNIDQSRMTDVGGKNFISLNQIKQVLFNEKDRDQQIFDERHEKYSEMIKDWNDYVEKMKLQNPEQKADRMIKSGCYLLNIVRGNKKLEKKDEIMFELIPFFELDKSKWWAGKEIYEKHIPTVVREWKTKRGIKSLGQMIYER